MCICLGISREWDSNIKGGRLSWPTPIHFFRLGSPDNLNLRNGPSRLGPRYPKITVSPTGLKGLGSRSHDPSDDFHLHEIFGQWQVKKTRELSPNRKVQ